MEEEWSLKGKEIDTWYKEEKDKEHWNIYHEKDIETLRKKLIELVYKSMMEDENPKWVIDQINKFFGVDKSGRKRDE